MDEFNSYHLLTQQPILTFLVTAILLVGVIVFVAYAVTSYREKRASKAKDQ